ncbi:phage tail tape measure protein [Halopseudomonas aestusnigri]|uniref:phage tail tape measure protein n=1 Tax=Halopseudomonas aestusnigri TaxID=857252 RepID=UPI001E616887|nr:phage tail tape measure protein [Halopseudomonas aestusnigri]UGV30965.1 phage tail tape measure protein [Halopseudomonas aestusnigri]
MASKSLGVLTVDLVAKVGGFVQGMDKAERSSAKWRKQVEKDLQAAGKAAGVAVAAVAGATVALVASQVQLANTLNQQAQLANAGVQEFQRYAIAADVVGISQEKLADQLKDFTEKVGEFEQTGGGGMKDFFEQIAPKIDLTADAFRGLSGPQALQLYYDSLEKAGASQEQMSFYLESMASDTTALIPLLRDGGAGFKLLGDQAELAGAIIGDKTLNSVDQLNAAIFISEQATAGFKNQISDALLPVLADLASEFSDVTADGYIAAEMGETLGNIVKGISAAAFGAYAAFQLFGKGIAAMAAGFSAAGVEASDLLFGPLAPAVVAGKVATNLDAFKGALEIGFDDIRESADKYATVLNGIWAAGSGNQTRDPTSRLNQVAALLKSMREQTVQTRRELTGFSEDNDEAAKAAAKAAEAIQSEITALERAAITWGMSADEVKIYDLQMQGATDTQIEYARTLLDTVSALDAQKEAAKELAEEQKRINDEVLNIVDALATEEERIQASYERRREIILKNTEVTGQAQTELLRRLEEDRDEQLLEINGSFWERWLESAEDNLTSFDDLSASVIENFSGQMGDAFESMVFDAETLEEAFAGIAESMLRSIVNALGQMAAQWLAYQAVQMLVSKTTQASGGATMATNAEAMSITAGINAFASTAAIPIVGPGLAPAAATAATAITAPMAAAVAGLTLSGMAHDGIDKVPATGTWLLEKGERVTTAETSAKMDRVLEDIRSGQRSSGGDSGGLKNLRIENRLDVDGISDALAASGSFERTVVNLISANSSAIRQALND